MIETDQNFDHIKLRANTNIHVSDLLNNVFTLGVLPTVKRSPHKCYCC